VGIQQKRATAGPGSGCAWQEFLVGFKGGAAGAVGVAMAAGAVGSARAGRFAWAACAVGASGVASGVWEPGLYGPGGWPGSRGANVARAPWSTGGSGGAADVGEALATVEAVGSDGACGSRVR
jgi:hypothetical protein